MVKTPELFLENLIARKLREQGITAPKKLAGKLASHVLNGKGEPFRYRGKAPTENVTLTVTAKDTDDLIKDLDRFCENSIPKLIPAFAQRISKSTLKHLKAKWAEEDISQSLDLAGFRERLEERWGKPLGQLRMLLTMSREWCQTVHERETRLKKHKQKQLREILIRLLARACQVTDEIICLLENGFADGAMARWRTLHEIAVVAAVISQHGEDIAERYLAHQAVESKRAMDKYIKCCALLGYKPLSAREQGKIVRAYDQTLGKYGKPFKSDHGWAAVHLKKDKPSFADLEEEAGRAAMRSYYQMGNDNIHAGVKSMFIRLGLLEDYTGLLAGRSNAGLTDPGQNTAHTLTQLSVLVCLSEPKLDDLVAAEMMKALRDKIPKSFRRADTRLRSDAKEHRQAVPNKQSN